MRKRLKTVKGPASLCVCPKPPVNRRPRYRCLRHGLWQDSRSLDVESRIGSHEKITHSDQSVDPADSAASMGVWWIGPPSVDIAFDCVFEALLLAHGMSSVIYVFFKPKVMKGPRYLKESQGAVDDAADEEWAAPWIPG